jgi:hypothetical protein
MQSPFLETGVFLRQAEDYQAPFTPVSSGVPILDTAELKNRLALSRAAPSCADKFFAISG